jgi:hypothetical protein
MTQSKCCACSDSRSFMRLEVNVASGLGSCPGGRSDSMPTVAALNSRVLPQQAVAQSRGIVRTE